MGVQPAGASRGAPPRVAIARHLRETEGLPIAQLAGRLGRSEATVKGYFYDPTGAKAKAVKARCSRTRWTSRSSGDGWDDLVRCAASLRDDTVTASLLVARLQAAGAKLPLTRAPQEYGRLVKTRFVLGYLADETERRAIGRQQNKRESLHALHDSCTATTAPCACTPSSASPPRRTACTSSPTRSSRYFVERSQVNGRVCR